MHADGGGLYLQVAKTASGRLNKSWLYRYAVAGRERQMGLGPLSEVKLFAARQKAAECRKQRLEGIDPIEALENARHNSRGKRRNISPRVRDVLRDEAQEPIQCQACRAVAINHGSLRVSTHW